VGCDVTTNGRELVASGKVRVVDMGGNEWWERVEVFEDDFVDGETPEDGARTVAMEQSTSAVETYEVDIS
jgi:hypothetical protein